MIRSQLTEIGIFLIPFADYALFVVAMRRGLLSSTSWPLHVIGKLVAGALLLVIASLILLARFSGSPPGSTYTPARVENGRLLPGNEK